MTQEQKAWIDAASYYDLLRRWRFAALGDPIFCGECGSYYKKIIIEKRNAITDEEAVKISKKIGW